MAKGGRVQQNGWYQLQKNNEFVRNMHASVLLMHCFLSLIHCTDAARALLQFTVASAGQRNTSSPEVTTITGWKVEYSPSFTVARLAKLISRPFKPEKEIQFSIANCWILKKKRRKKKIQLLPWTDFWYGKINLSVGHFTPSLRMCSKVQIVQSRKNMVHFHNEIRQKIKLLPTGTGTHTVSQHVLLWLVIHLLYL